MNKGQNFKKFGIPELVGMKPFVIYDSDLECPEHVEYDIWNDVSENYTHAYFVPSNGDSIWVGALGLEPVVSHCDYSERFCLGKLFYRMNEEEQSQFILNFDKIKQLFSRSVR